MKGARWELKSLLNTLQKSPNAEAAWQLLKIAIDRLNDQPALLRLPSRKSPWCFWQLCAK
jgi:hypothetical protein